MANLDLTKYGITGTTEVLHNPSYEVLFEAEMDPSLKAFERGIHLCFKEQRWIPLSKALRRVSSLNSAQ